MNFTLLDRSNYLRGLLILIGKDRKISEEEKELFRKLSDILGFSKDFCETAMEELLENEFIMEEPPKFSNDEVAKLFIQDGIKLAFADKEIHLYEMSWLRSVAEVNSIDHLWSFQQFEHFKKNNNDDNEFEIAKMLSKKK
jgi:hypothetical protein